MVCGPYCGHTVVWWQSLHFIQHVPQKGHCGRQCHHRVPFCGSGLDIHNEEVRSLDSVSAIVKVMILIGFVLVFARDNEKKTVQTRFYFWRSRSVAFLAGVARDKKYAERALRPEGLKFHASLYMETEAIVSPPTFKP
jgi:hypothetical protein